MRTNRIVVLPALFLLILFSTPQATVPPDLMNYQGVLRDSAGNPVADASYSMVFRLFSAPTGGDEILIDSHSAVPVTGGLFNVRIGGVGGSGEGVVTDGGGPGRYVYLPKVFADYPAVYLQVEVQGEILTPRTRVVSSAYSHNARYVNGVEVASAGPLNLHVDAVSGNDENPGTAPGLPKRTIQAAIDRIPMIVTDDVTVHIASGDYAGGITLAGRSAPGLSQITLEGDPSVTLSPSGGEEWGILVYKNAPMVTLNNITITGSPTGFPYGLIVSGSRVTLQGCQIELSTNNGIDAWHDVDLTIGDGVSIHNNGRHGISCGKAYLHLESTSVSTRAIINDNGAKGISAGPACQVELDGPVEIAHNGEVGVGAWEGGYANLYDNPDVSVHDNTECELRAQAHSSVRRYFGASVPDVPCECDTEDNGICNP